MPMQAFKCPTCGEEIAARASEVFHACPRARDARTKRYGKTVYFDALPPFPEPEFADGVVNVMGFECYVDEDGYAYSTDKDEPTIVNVHHNWAEMLASF
mgnify:FL=1